MRMFYLLLCACAAALAQTEAPRIWDDKALNDWATPIAALNVRPGHYTAAEYYTVPADNLKTYPVFHPDKEPPGYWEWLQKQKSEPLVDAGKIRTREDWISAGKVAFESLDNVNFRTSDPEKIRRARDVKSYEGVWTQQDGSLLYQRWVVTPTGIQLSMSGCTGCHARVLPDGQVLWAASQVTPPGGNRTYIAVGVFNEGRAFQGDSPGVTSWRQFTTPWDPDPRVEKLRDVTEAELREIRRGTWGTATRIHGSPFMATKIPDLHTVRFSRYMDASATHRLRGPEDIGRYAAFVTTADPMEFGPHKILKAENRIIPYRYADEVLYAIGMYLMSLEPPKNPAPPSAERVERGRRVFQREGCGNCHTPPNYTSGMLTPASGYVVPSDHPYKKDIVRVSVGTDSGLALKTRKGTGFYKIPSLRGLWYRPLLLHDGSVASLEEMFNPDRLEAEYVPGGWKGPGVTKRAVPGHPFGLGLPADEKSALLDFLRSL